MDRNQETVQWSFLVQVLHGQQFGHRIEYRIKSRGRQEYVTSGGNWKGLGVPKEILDMTLAHVDAIVGDHLVTRYGIQDELPLKWSGDPDPF